MTRPFGVHHAASNSGFLSSRLRSLLSWPCKKSFASAPVTWIVRCRFHIIEGYPVTAATVRVWHTLAMHAEDPKNEAGIVDSKSMSQATSKANCEGESRDDHSLPAANESKKELGGRGGLDPTRYGDWEKAGRCIDF